MRATREGRTVDKKQTYQTTDEYIALFPAAVQKKLKEMRRLIKEVAPGATERISYQMPSFYLNGNLVYFGAHTNHIGFYPTSSGIAKFAKELKGYRHSKGAVQFPLDKPLPREIIQRIVRFRVQENLKRRK
jgi:uncharacterized protein YdhG (YjbR/CyaY superfamily)